MDGSIDLIFNTPAGLSPDGRPRFAGYEIEKGKLSIDVTYKVENRALDAKQKFVIDQLQLGDKVESPDAVSLPLKLAVALLKDRNGVIDIDLPGVDPAGIDISVDRKVLTVRAERKRVEREGVKYVVAERPTGAVSRQVFLSESLDTDRLEARYENGVLNLSIPVTEKAKPRKFEVAGV